MRFGKQLQLSTAKIQVLGANQVFWKKPKENGITCDTAEGQRHAVLNTQIRTDNGTLAVTIREAGHPKKCGNRCLFFMFCLFFNRQMGTFDVLSKCHKKCVRSNHVVSILNDERN